MRIKQDIEGKIEEVKEKQTSDELSKKTEMRQVILNPFTCNMWFETFDDALVESSCCGCDES